MARGVKKVSYPCSVCDRSTQCKRESIECSDCLVELMRQNTAAGRPTWTNNNCESMNHVLKQCLQWRPHQLPDLIDKLRSLVDGQYADADRAMCGLGDYVLRPEYARHRQTVDVWRQMSCNQRRKAAEACFKLPRLLTSSTSTDGTLTVPITPGGGKKINQRKMKRAERTVTVRKRPATAVEVQSDNDFSS